MFRSVALRVALLALSLVCGSASAHVTFDSGKTPYQVLDELYQGGRPATSADFHTIEQAIQRGGTWKVLDTFILKGTRRERMSEQWGWLFLDEVKKVIPGTPAGSGSGPLFPGAPAKPETVLSLRGFINCFSSKIEECRMSPDTQASVYDNSIQASYGMSETSSEFKTFLRSNGHWVSDLVRVNGSFLVLRREQESTPEAWYTYGWIE
jgi:hypothetical protein